MNCLLETTGEIHKSGRELLRCTRRGCHGKALAGRESIRCNCYGWPYLREWGEWAALFLEALWITPDLVAWLKWKLGLVEVSEGGCGGCEARKRWLNTLGGRLSQSTSRAGKWLYRALVWKN
jgi:hypothetical protein